MPTGYTSQLYDKEVSFEDFTWNCARAFGALVELRDDATAPIPKKFKPNAYHVNKIAESKLLLKQTESWTTSEANSAAKLSFRAAMKAWTECHENNIQREKRYRDMVKEIRSWSPPSKEHEGLKTFMLEQIETSFEFDTRDYDKPIEVSGAHFKVDAIAKLHRDIAYHETEHQKEIERANERTEWVAALRDSLLRARK